MSVYFGIGFAVAIVGIIVIVGIVQSQHTFACGNCGKEFKAKWTQLLFEYHAFEEHDLKCPHCHVKCMCTDKGKK